MSSIALRRIASIARVARPQMGAVRLYSEGDTGAPRAGQGDAFNKREKAQEDLYVRQREAERLKSLRQEISKKEQEIADLKKHEAELADK